MIKLKSALASACLFLFLAANLNASETPEKTKSNQAPAQLRSEVIAGVEYNLTVNNLADAEDILKKAMSRYPTDYEFIRLKGILETKQNNIVAARQSLNQAASSNEEAVRGKSLYILTAIEHQVGNGQALRNTLERLSNDPAFSKAIAFAVNDIMAGRYIRDLDDQKLFAAIRSNKPGWSTSVTLNSGYDSNVSLIPDSGGTKEGGAYTTPSITTNHIGRLMGTKLGTYGTLGYTKNLSEANKNNNSLNAGIGAEWALPGEAGWLHQLSLRNDLSATFVEQPTQKLYLGSNTLTLQKEAWYTETNRVIFGLPIGYIAYPGVDDTGDNVRDGSTIGFSVTNMHMISDWNLYQALSFNRQNSLGKTYRSNGVNLSVGADTTIFNSIGLGLSGGFSKTTYPEATTGRVDTGYNAGLSLTRGLQAMPIWIGGGVNYQRNDSSYTTANYNKNIYYVKVTSQF